MVDAALTRARVRGVFKNSTACFVVYQSLPRLIDSYRKESSAGSTATRDGDGHSCVCRVPCL